MQTGSPAGMVDGNVNNDFSIAEMDGIDQFEKLFQRRGRRIEFGQRRVNGKAGLFSAIVDQPGEFVADVLALHDHIDKAVLHYELSRLEAFR